MVRYWIDIFYAALSSSIDVIGESFASILYSAIVLALGGWLLYAQKGIAGIKAEWAKTTFEFVAILVLAWVPFFLWHLARAPYLELTREREAKEAQRGAALGAASEVGSLKQERDRLRTRVTALEAADAKDTAGSGQVQKQLKSAQDEVTRLKAAADERERRKAIVNTLGRLIMEGRELQRACADESKPPPTAEADKWAGVAEQFLRANLGDGYVGRFRSHAGLPLSANSIQSIPHRNLWGGIETRLARLDQFISEITK